MAKINDTTVFPTAVAAPDDLILGSDVSNTANDSNGETVNFTPVSLQNVYGGNTSWHNYDGAYPGDGSTGIIWDHSVDGSVFSIDTPTFEDGYDYGIFFQGVSSQAFSYKLNYSNASSSSLINPSTGGTTNRTGIFYFPMTRLPKFIHNINFINPINDLGLTSAGITATALKINSVELTFSNASFRFTSGSIRLIRKRQLLTL